MILIPSCICFLNNLNILSILFLDYSVISIFWWDISPIWKDFSFFLYLLSSSFFSCALKCVVTIHVEQGLLFTQFRTRSWVVSFGSWSTKTAKIPDWANLSPLLVPGFWCFYGFLLWQTSSSVLEMTLTIWRFLKPLLMGNLSYTIKVFPIFPISVYRAQQAFDFIPFSLSCV